MCEKKEKCALRPLDSGILLFTLLAGSFDLEEVYEASDGVVIYLKILDFGKSKPWNDLTLFASPTSK